jgi:PKD repeat protein
MEFRWVAIIAMWTLLTGPIFHGGFGSGHAPQAPAANATAKAPSRWPPQSALDGRRPDCVCWLTTITPVTEDGHVSEPAIESAQGSKIAGWIKHALTSLLGLLGGAALMYASPLLDKVVKPAKPLANFQYEASGLKVTFQNKSTSAHEGWWDFGDGSALEPFDPDQATAVHTYPRAGNYTVKLSLKNLIGEENERDVAVVLDPTGTAAPPSIDTFEVVPVLSDYAPATFRVITKVKDANLFVWAVSDRAVEISTDTGAAGQEKFLTFKDPGTQVVKLVAWNGKQAVEKVQTVVIKQPPIGMVTANVAVTYEAVFVEQKVTSKGAKVTFPPDQAGDIFKFNQAVFMAEEGFEIVKADFANPVKDVNVKAPVLHISADKKQVTVTGELLKAARQAAQCYFHLAVTQQRTSASALKKVEPVAVNLAMPGTTLVPLPTLPSGWVAKTRKIALALQQDGKKVEWKEGDLPRNAAMQMPSGGAVVLSAVEQGDQLRIDVAQVKNSWGVWGN